MALVDRVRRIRAEADGGAGAGVDHPAHAAAARGLEHVAGALDGGTLDLRRVRREVAVDRADVEHQLDAVHRTIDAARIQELAGP